MIVGCSNIGPYDRQWEGYKACSMDRSLVDKLQMFTEAGKCMRTTNKLSNLAHLSTYLALGVNCSTS